MNKKVFAFVTGYGRVSTPDQVNDGVSLEVQEKKLRAWCLIHDYELIAFYSDEGLSGKRIDNRKAVQKAIEEACRNKGILAVYSLSRLSRSVTDTLQIVDRLHKAGADLVSLTENIDTTTATGKMLFKIMAVLNEFEREQIGERVKAAMDYLRDQGKRVSRFPQYGYDFDEKGNCIPNEDELFVIEEMLQMRERNMTLQGIADNLNEQGFYSKTGKLWSPTTVRGVLIKQSTKLAL